MHKKVTILINTAYIESNLPSNAVAAVHSIEHFVPDVGGAQNECDKLNSVWVLQLSTPYCAILRQPPCSATSTCPRALLRIILVSL